MRKLAPCDVGRVARNLRLRRGRFASGQAAPVDGVRRGEPQGIAGRSGHGVRTRRRCAAVRVSYAASSALARQIEQGAPADVFVSADLDWMDALQKQKLIDPRRVATCWAIRWSWLRRRNQKSRWR
jgi:hypothetical protein